MTDSELLTRLRGMHEELSGINIDLDDSEEVDEDTIEVLGQLVSDVGRLVDQFKEATEETDLKQEHSGLADRISEFDHQHPRVRAFMSQMTDLLAMIGI